MFGLDFDPTLPQILCVVAGAVVLWLLSIVALLLLPIKPGYKAIAVILVIAMGPVGLLTFLLGELVSYPIDSRRRRARQAGGKTTRVQCARR